MWETRSLRFPRKREIPALGSWGDFPLPSFPPLAWIYETLCAGLDHAASYVNSPTNSAIQPDFYPWGGVVPGVGQTTSTNTVKFTGKYRDSETQLDYFGARYYANVSGRFMTPDWAAKPTSVPYADFGDPQSLNLYAYVRNSPIVRVDADGHGYAMFSTQNPSLNGDT
jgi:RHS repeat-associated protein